MSSYKYIHKSIVLCPEFASLEIRRAFINEEQQIPAGELPQQLRVRSYMFVEVQHEAGFIPGIKVRKMAGNKIVLYFRFPEDETVFILCG